MGRAPCCDKANVKRGPWSPEEDAKLKDYIHSNGTGGNWIALPQKAGLKRCGKSCRLRWLNYLRPNIKHGEFSDEEDAIICTLFAVIGSRWSIIAGQLAGRTDNDIKNYWNTKLKKKLMSMPGNIINPNPPLMLSHQSKSPSPDSINVVPSSFSTPIPFISSPNYYNTPPSLTGFDQSAGLLVSPSPMQDNSDVVYGGAAELACTSQSSGEAMGYGLEEIKQLISPNTPTSIGNYFDEGSASASAGERVMMYYYGGLV